MKNLIKRTTRYHIKIVLAFLVAFLVIELLIIQDAIPYLGLE